MQRSVDERRQSHDQTRACRACLGRDGSVVGVHQVGDDGKAEPAAAGIGRSGIVEPTEAFEHRGAVLLRDPIAVVRDEQFHNR